MHASMSEKFGSMEFHSEKAEALGVDVIWWTEHDWRMSNWRHMKRYDFEATVWNQEKYRWEEPDEDGYPQALRHWTRNTPWKDFLQTEVSDTLAYEGTQSLRLTTAGDPGNPQFDSEYLSQTAEQLQNKYSLAKRLRVRFAVFPEDLDPVDARFVVQTELSDHPGTTNILRYVLGSMSGEGVHSIPLAYTPGVWNEYELDVTADAISHFSLGGIDTLRAEDNSLGILSIGVETRDGTPATVFFDDYHMDPDPLIVDDVLMDKARAIGAYYETIYSNVTQFVGYEISRFKAQPHLNGYAPNIAPIDYTGHNWPDTLYYAIDQIHEQGGAVSLNHFFGPQDPQEPEPPEQHAARLLFTKQVLIDAWALGVDILEVGYRWRGGMSLWEHIDLWDVLNANAIFLTGNGITDSHGRGWRHIFGWEPAAPGDTTTNNFTSWLYTEALSEAGFVESMRRGRMYFGDPYRYSGMVDLKTLDGFRMGQVVLTDRPEHDVAIEVTGFPPDGKVRLVQVEIQESTQPGPPYYTDPVFLRDEFLVGTIAPGTFTDTVSVDTSIPSFVRIETYDGNSDEMVFSNPLYFVTSVPQAGIAADRVAVRVDEVRLFLAEEFRLTGAAIDGPTGVLTITGDETMPGAGVLSIDPGLLGAPSDVTGADSWEYVSGVLRLAGFDGPGSTIQVFWGATAADLTSSGPARFALSPGRPNPFGAGTLSEYSIPKSGWVRLEVLDVSGRRVRTLDLGFRESGLHRARWDGTDEGGRPVAAGVYWLRLEHDGRSLSRKAVRLH
jgi:hypothetical protein